MAGFPVYGAIITALLVAIAFVFNSIRKSLIRLYGPGSKDEDTIESDYGTREYWDKRYVREDVEFEWYRLDFETLAPLFEQLFFRDSKLLEMGCGSSPLAEDARKAGYSSILAVDFCDKVINQMQSRYSESRWEIMDLSNMENCKANSFDGAFDKGTMDGLLGAFTESDLNRARNVTAEIARVLRPNATWLCVGIHGPEKFGECLKTLDGALELHSSIRTDVEIKPGKVIKTYAHIVQKKATLETKATSEQKATKHMQTIDEAVEGD